MVEMMVAIVILGLGLLMAATMFPVAWTRARDLAEFTTQTTAAETAATTVRLLTSVAAPIPGGGGPPFQTQTSFLGDHDPAFDPAAPPNLLVDDAVHVLHIQNALADPNSIPPSGEVAWPEWYLHNTPDLSIPQQANSIQIDPSMQAWWALVPPQTPPGAQIAFHERVIPPLPGQPLPTDPVPPTPDEVDRWNTMLQGRRFAWAVLHKLDDANIQPGEPRSFTMYFVTLRRGQSRDPGPGTAA